MWVLSLNPHLLSEIVHALILEGEPFASFFSSCDLQERGDGSEGLGAWALPSDSSSWLFRHARILSLIHFNPQRD